MCAEFYAFIPTVWIPLWYHGHVFIAETPGYLTIGPISMYLVFLIRTLRYLVLYVSELTFYTEFKQ